MAKNRITISDNLKEDLKTYSVAMCVSLAAQVRDEMYEEAQFAIDTFYNHYQPLYYNRTKDGYNFKKKSFKKYYKNPHNSIIRGGIELTPSNMDDLYRADTGYVFDLVYSGHHGNVGAFGHEIFNIPPVMSPSPLDILLKKRDMILDNIEEYKHIAIDNAKSKSYSVIKI